MFHTQIFSNPSPVFSAPGNSQDPPTDTRLDSHRSNLSYIIDKPDVEDRVVCADFFKLTLRPPFRMENSMNLIPLRKQIVPFFFVFATACGGDPWTPDTDVEPDTAPDDDGNEGSFGTEATLEVMTWNVEEFPKNGQATIDTLQQSIDRLDVDLIAFQEITDPGLFEQMVENLDGWAAYLESGYYGGLVYLYKTDVIEVRKNFEIYTTSQYWRAFPRSPQVMEFAFRGREFVIINTHLKCCGDGAIDTRNPEDEETRRLEATNLLKGYIDTHYPGDRVILLGDFNDMLSDVPADNVFEPFLSDGNNYRFMDMSIANGSGSEWSFPTYPSHLDHILVTDELFCEAGDHGTVQTVKVDAYLPGGWDEYEQIVSDHRPVALKLSAGTDACGR